MKKFVLLCLISLSSFLIIGCSANVNENAQEYSEVTIEEAYEIYKNKEMVILDVRTPQEYNEGHIPGSILIPLQELESRLGELDKNEKYLIVCRSGNRSAQASELLVANGFKNISHMQGGMLEWKYDIEKG
ncbi:rhodanese-like domain-containing protein [Bacillus alkalisoli]|uniref:rhodanese-like domain-containing protein n=1 Tax=Bacillus alkalisoli TaxID=2011008 RepID=UPI000C239DC8|nr:rhodanese-like domain-containing protein [Bacillus alkalisoli]